MFGPLMETWLWVKGLVPRFSSIKSFHLSFSFIMLHYTYIIGMSIIGSIILYGSRNMAYIDALFQSTGSATQSGLNTININDLFLYQQITIMLISCVCNPIIIHGSVVFVRLYWFEKRFQNVVLEARRLKRTRERSRTKDEPRGGHKNDPDLENGHLRSRKPAVIRAGQDTIESAEATARKDEERRETESKDHSRGGTGKPNRSMTEPQGQEELHGDDTRNITFVNEPKPVRRQTSNLDRLPVPQSAETHIAFVENQRNPKHEETLYIPGPRDFDRGKGPQQIDNNGGISPTISHAETFPSIPEENGSVKNHSRSNIADDTRWHPRRAGTVVSDSVVLFTKAKRSISSAIGGRLPIHRDHNDDENHGSSKDHDSDPKNYGLRYRSRTKTFASFKSSRTQDNDILPYLSYQPTIGRNSAFVNLSESQREELGGIEYRALKLLAVVLVVYYFGFHILGISCYMGYILHSGNRKGILYGDGVTPAWWGIFTPASMFTDLGMTLTPDSMISFNNAVFILLVGSFLIVIGNTGFPCMLRFVIWLCSLVVPVGSAVWEEFRFLLDHPRRCFTLLFPSDATWWLFWVLVLLNGIDLVFFIILDLHDQVVSILPPGIRVLDGLFQAASTRTAGFTVVNLAELHPAIQVSYLIMMYISVYPIAISIRRTNVYEEKSLGIYDPPGKAEAEGKDQSYIGQHLRRQLSFDLWFVFLGLFIIAIVEGSQLQAPDQTSFTLFAVLFEVVSSYGTVGLSLGYPTTDASLSSQFHTLSKLVIIAMQVRGRHRGLPYALDKAILLPSEHLQRKEAEMTTATTISDLPALNGLPTARTDGEETAEKPGTLNKRTTGLSEGGRTARSATVRSAGGGLMRLISKGLATGPQPKRDE